MATAYLLESQSHNVNHFRKWNRESSLTAAAMRGCPSVIRALLAAGADPYHRDCNGLNAMDYASQHPLCAQEMHSAGYLQELCQPETRRQIVYDTIRARCNMLLLQSTVASSAVDALFRLWRVNELFEASISIQDYSAAKVAYIEAFQSPRDTLVRFTIRCDLCWSFVITDVCICKTCFRLITLCSRCHIDYTDAGLGAPEAVKEIMKLEKQIQSVRKAVPYNSNFSIIYQAMEYFEASVKWVDDILEKYEAWEHKFDAGSKYRDLSRPGQELLKMVKKAREVLVEATSLKITT